MRLIRTNNARLKEYSSGSIPPYAILSHRWTSDEVTFSHLHGKRNAKPTRSTKFSGFLQQAESDGLEFGWLDTCCINRDSSAELAEAINSMYQWYQNAHLCYVYMADVDRKHWHDSFPKSKWFQRGWTLQELLAPQDVIFYDRHWQFLGSKASLADKLSLITGIPHAALKNENLQQFSIAQRMSWAAKRVTTIVEDSAYCLMGIFDVNMPLLYGERHKAFLRLQEEIIKRSDDHSIFAWSMGRKRASGLLAHSPQCFAGSLNTVSSAPGISSQPFSMTNRGLCINLRITPWSANTYLAYINCYQIPEPNSQVEVGVFLRRLSESDQYARINLSEEGLWTSQDQQNSFWARPTQSRTLFVRQDLHLLREESWLADHWYGFKLSNNLVQVVASTETDRARKRYVAVLRPGDWGCVTVCDISAATDGLKQFALGFDFDFNPVCIVQDSNTDAQLNIRYANAFDWSSSAPDDIDWDQITRGRVYLRENHDGLWLLRGDRISGLDVLVPAGRSGGSLVTLHHKAYRNKLIWELDVDNLVGPLRNHHHQVLKRGFKDRQGFQAAYGLDMTAEGLEDGDEILRAMYDLERQFESV